MCLKPEEEIKNKYESSVNLIWNFIVSHVSVGCESILKYSVPQGWDKYVQCSLRKLPNMKQVRQFTDPLQTKYRN
jgi:hypothetical protein